MDSKVFNVAEYRTRFTCDKTYGEIVQGEQAKLFFPFKDPNEFCDIPTHELKDRIVFHHLNCSHCTDSFTLRDDGIEINFNSNGAGIQGDRSPYFTSFRIFLDDGKKLMVNNNLGQPVYNPDKAQLTFEIYGTIRLNK